MKSFKSYLAENYDVPVTHFTADGAHESLASQNLSNKETRDEINVQLLRATAGQFTNPYLSLMKVAKLLAVYGVLLPRPYFPAVDGGEMIWVINPDGQMHDYNTSVPASEKDVPKWFLYFEYGVDTDGAYVCYSEICDMDGLDDLLEEELDEENLDESLPKNASAGDYVKDFVHSKNSKFDGDSKKERIRRALGAYYSKKNEELDTEKKSLNENLLTEDNELHFSLKGFGFKHKNKHGGYHSFNHDKGVSHEDLHKHLVNNGYRLTRSDRSMGDRHDEKTHVYTKTTPYEEHGVSISGHKHGEKIRNIQSSHQVSRD